MNVALEILKQLGGNKFIVMTGVKNLVSCEDALLMNLPRNKSKAKCLRIELNNNDTYTLIFRANQTKDFTFPIVEKVEDVYNDMLQDIFTNVTGLYTSL